MSPEIDDIGFGSHGHVEKSENHENEGFPGFPKKIREVTSPKCSRIILRSFWANLLIKFTMKIALPTPSFLRGSNLLLTLRKQEFLRPPANNCGIGSGPLRLFVATWRRPMSSRKDPAFAFPNPHQSFPPPKKGRFPIENIGNPQKIWIWGRGVWGGTFILFFQKRVAPKAP